MVLVVGLITSTIAAFYSLPAYPLREAYFFTLSPPSSGPTLPGLLYDIGFQTERPDRCDALVIGQKTRNFGYQYRGIQLCNWAALNEELLLEVSRMVRSHIDREFSKYYWNIAGTFFVYTALSILSWLLIMFALAAVRWVLRGR